MLLFDRSGAGGGSRTLVLSLGRIHNSRYTTPAGSYILAQKKTPEGSFLKWRARRDSNARPPP